MVAFRGKGAKVQYTELVMSAQASIAFAGDGLLSVTPDYKHLGSFQYPNCSLRHELRVRGHSGNMLLLLCDGISLAAHGFTLEFA